MSMSSFEGVSSKLGSTHVCVSDDLMVIITGHFSDYRICR